MNEELEVLYVRNKEECEEEDHGDNQTLGTRK